MVRINLAKDFARCSACNHYMGTHHFAPQPARSGGISAYCHACDRVRDRQRYPREAERRRSAIRQWRQDNVEHRKAWEKKYRKLNPHYVAKKSSRKYHRKAVGFPLDGHIPTQTTLCECCGRHGKVLRHHEHLKERNNFVAWLCVSCNHAAGLLLDSPTKIRRFVDFASREGVCMVPRSLSQLRILADLLESRNQIDIALIDNSEAFMVMSGLSRS